MNNPASTPISVLMASSEIAPYAKTGGLGDVLQSLPGAMLGLGARVSLIMPAYRSVLTGGYQLQDPGIRLTIPISDWKETAVILRGTTPDNVPIQFVSADRYFDRSHIYGTPDGDYPDNAERFAFFCRVILEVMRKDPPTILHAHDWQTAMAILFLKSQPDRYPELQPVKTVLTVHNLGYQGTFSQRDWHVLNLDPELFNLHELEFYGTINFLKGGLVHADAITTVSPTYAQEIKTHEQGFRLQGVFQERAAVVSGILNGVDYRVWDPRTDPHIAARYGHEDTSPKALCKLELQRLLGLNQDPRTPVIGMVTRLSSQKGVDLVGEAIDGITGLNCQLAVLGSGDRALQDLFSRLPAEHPGQVGVEIGFSDELAHKIIAGSDFILLPSRYEPGGLTQLYALRYGTIPIVRATGGLRDTVTEFHPEHGKGNGFVFYPYEPRRLVAAVARARTVYDHGGRHWLTLLKNAMSADFSWTRSAAGYLEVYRKVLAGNP